MSKINPRGATPDSNEAVTADVDAAVAAAAGLRLMGWAARESDGTPAVAAFNITHGATGPTVPVVPVELAANAMAGAWYGPDGILCPDGISVEHVAGTFDVTIYHETAPQS